MTSDAGWPVAATLPHAAFLMGVAPMAAALTDAAPTGTVENSLKAAASTMTFVKQMPFKHKLISR